MVTEEIQVFIKYWGRRSASRSCGQRAEDTRILVEMYHSVGWRPRLFRLEGYRRKLQEICLGWVEDEILPDGWLGKRSREEESRSRRKELSRDTRQGGATTWLDGDKGCSY